ncbi:MAG: transmembrane oligosaccharyl transferase [Candidatus Syntrophoarchaeum butanivorans]|uniref:dolichyl-phosphooligosaccharide-protein glycotransferase n=2 Tax=Candidatus Syntropharchaeum butanivorans TaxID=1839936 RepID=A0A1F2P5W2_9EURY|nr:MAG: transmembrane oligosaccharyl transferase [Candidatus Syntrophoarchaeum butanivorans]
MEMKNPFKDRGRMLSLVYGILVALTFTIALYIRCLPKSSVFGGGFVRFGGNDPWYNMRIVENTLSHFPHRINFDAYTYFPHGQYHPFAFLFDQILAFIIWVAGLGAPSQHLAEVIGAYYPAVLGALTVIPVYIIGKEIYNRNVGILSAALLAVLPGQFLSRSLLGFTDHHVMETLLATWVIAFFVITVKSAQNQVTLDEILNREWARLRKPVLYSTLTGIMLGSYILAWKGGALYVLVMVVYALIQAVVDHMRGRDTAWLVAVTVPAFLVVSFMITPFLHPSTIDMRTLLAVLVSIIGVIGVVGISLILRSKQIERAAYPFTLIISAGLGLFVFSIIAPDTYHSMTGMFSIFLPGAGALTVAEIHPMTMDEAWTWFTTSFFIAFGGIFWAGYNVARRFRAEELLFVVWSIIMLLACRVPIINGGQNRFAAYYAINVALLTGFLLWKFIEFGALSDEREPVKERTKRRHKQEERESLGLKRYINLDLILISIIIFAVVFYPPLFTPRTGALAYAKFSGGPSDDWYYSLMWMRNNTPDVATDGFNYSTLYEDIPRGEDYPYPPNAYGIMSWWDYGHWITRIAHRIPIANPFQAGIGGPYQGNRPGACVFFITRNETRANEVMDALGGRYVISDFMMADAWNAVYNKFGAMTVWADDTGGYYGRMMTENGTYRTVLTRKYYSTMIARLHILDGRGLGDAIEPLRHYRLIHESRSLMPIEVEGQPVRFVKIFEYVKGANLIVTPGFGSNATNATVSVEIMTNQGRYFNYTQTARLSEDGKFHFTLPYSTEGPLPGETRFDTMPTGPYLLEVGGVVREVHITERDVLEGKTLELSL